MLAITVGGRLVVGEYVGRRAQARFDARLAGLRAEGRPTSAGDLVAAQGAVPDDRNAVVPLLAATRPIDPSADAFAKLSNADLNLPLNDDERRLLPDALAPAAEVRRHMRLAATRPAAEWRVPFVSPLLDTSHPNLSPLHSLGYLLRFDAFWAVDRGEGRAAFEAVGHLFASARVAEAYPTEIGQLVAGGAMARAVDTMEAVAASVVIGGGRQADVPPQAVRTLIVELLDERSAGPALQRALDADRVLVIDTVERMADGRMLNASVPSGHAGWFANLNLRMARGQYLSAGDAILADAATAFAVAARSPDWPTCLAELPPAAKGTAALPPGADPRLALLMPRVDRACLQHYERLARRRLAATGLAVHLYAAAHGGRRPATLAELVPDYVPAVPADPLTVGQPLRYVANGDRPMVYSVGQDGKDDGGADYAATTPFDFTKLSKTLDEPAGGRYAGDLSFHLKPRPRPPALPLPGAKEN